MKSDVRLKKIATGTTGSEIAEAALVLPIFFLIMLGIYWFGRAFNTYATINHAAREGARVGVAQTCATCGNATAVTDPKLPPKSRSPSRLPASIQLRSQTLGEPYTALRAEAGSYELPDTQRAGSSDLRLLQCATAARC